MEWTMPVNEMLRDVITKLNYTLVPPGFHGDVRSMRVMQESLSRVIDTLGEQSAAAQGLNKVITTAEKLRNSTEHTLYLLKDAAACGGRGEVIALLKVGRKHLFLFDQRERVCEVDPLCVLDFFVLHDRQRHGYGRLLFDHMLQDTQSSAQQLAVDGPSPKMEQFLRKNYGVERLLRQNNNFAVAPQFFETCVESSRSGRSTPATAAAVGRFAAPKPPSAIATVIHGGGGALHRGSGDGSASEVAAQSEPPPTDLATPAELEPKLAELELTPAEPEPAEEPGAEPEEPKWSPERPSTLRVESVASPACAPAASPAGSTLARRDSQLTERGYFDVKFYHNKLW